MGKPALEITYYIYDTRYLSDPASARCFNACTSLHEAMTHKKDFGDDYVVVQTTSEATNEGLVEISAEIVYAPTNGSVL